MSGLRVAALLAALAMPQQVQAPSGGAATPGAEVRSVLGERDYPWYDPQRDAVRPVMPDPASWSRRIGKRIEAFFDWLGDRFKSDPNGSGRSEGNPAGQLLSTLLMLAAGGLFVFMLWRLWRLYDPTLDSGSGREARIGDAARIAGLGPGMALEGVDPWAEALRRRAEDPGAAVIWLFLDQLLSLQRAGIIRLTPGRTARQYARSLDDPVLADGLQATLRAFEDVYYGHRLPPPDALAAVWTKAELFRRRLEAIKGEN
jgi:hypothetical protein